MGGNGQGIVQINEQKTNGENDFWDFHFEFV
jgi:hypothetical protein